MIYHEDIGSRRRSYDFTKINSIRQIFRSVSTRPVYKGMHIRLLYVYIILYRYVRYNIYVYKLYIVGTRWWVRLCASRVLHEEDGSWSPREQDAQLDTPRRTPPRTHGSRGVITQKVQKRQRSAVAHSEIH